MPSRVLVLRGLAGTRGREAQLPDVPTFLKKIKPTNVIKDVILGREVLFEEVTFKKGWGGGGVYSRGKKQQVQGHTALYADPEEQPHDSHGGLSYSVQEANSP